MGLIIDIGRHENQSGSHSPQISLQDYGMRFLVKWLDRQWTQVSFSKRRQSVTVNSDKTGLCHFTLPGVYSKTDNLFHNTKDYLPLPVFPTKYLGFPLRTTVSSSKEKRQAHFTSMAKSSKQTTDISPHEVHITGNC